MFKNFVVLIVFLWIGVTMGVAMSAEIMQYVQIKTDNFNVRLSIYGDGIVRTQIFIGLAPEDRYCPSVIAKPLNKGYKFTENIKEAVLNTSKLKVVVNKTTGQIKYYDATGKLLTQTAADGGCKISDAEGGGVSQQFLLEKNEHLFGVGQYVNGLPYVNGTGCTLEQTNMEDAAHVLMSDKGYGMFWNNPSGGQFEAFGNHELLSDRYVKTIDGHPGFQASYYPGDSQRKQELKDKFKKGEITKTIDIGENKSAIDIMRSDFDLATTKKKVAENGITLLYQGTIHTPERTGWYYFNIANAGRGVRFAIDGERIIENRIPHSYSWNSGRKWLTGNTSYTFELYFSHFDNNPALQVYWDPNEDLYKQYTWKSKKWSTSDFFIYTGSNYDDIMNGLYTLTGKVPILPKWSLAYIHCQAIPFWTKDVNCFTPDDFNKLIDYYRGNQVPCDMLVQDFMWWTSMGSHIFRPDCYPDMQAMVNKIHTNNFKFMISVWPILDSSQGAGYTGKLTDADLKNWREMHTKGLILDEKDQNGKFVRSWGNFIMPEARDIFWRQVKESLYNDKLHVDAFWLDADEGGMKDERYSDAYPLLYKMTYGEGARKAYPDTRTFMLGRSLYPGAQRYDGGMWSGDIGNDFYSLQTQVSAGLSVSACGMPYWTTDIGGFGGGFTLDPDYANGKNHQDKTFREVVARWFQYGMFCPLFRLHRADNDAAPWFYGDTVGTIITNTIKFRYRLMPYVYSLTKQTRDNGINPMRPLFMDFGHDKKTVDITQQFMYGPAFLVCPVTKALYYPYPGEDKLIAEPQSINDKSISVYLPAGTDWYDFKTGEKFNGGKTISASAPMDWMPLYVKAGSIVPMGNVIQNTTSEKQTELELRIYPGKDAEFVLYDDDGVSYQYEKDAFTEIALHWNNSKQELTIGERKGSYEGMPEKLVFKPVVVREDYGTGSLKKYDGDAQIEYTGQEVRWKNVR